MENSVRQAEDKFSFWAQSAWIPQAIHNLKQLHQTALCRHNIQIQKKDGRDVKPEKKTGGGAFSHPPAPGQVSNGSKKKNQPWKFWEHLKTIQIFFSFWNE